jgi:hypothetical protein
MGDERRVLSPTFRLEVTPGTVPDHDVFEHPRNDGEPSR